MTMTNTESGQMDTVIFLGSGIFGRGEDRQLGALLKTDKVIPCDTMTGFRG
jgi:hypothetical protein